MSTKNNRQRGFCATVIILAVAVLALVLAGYFLFFYQSCSLVSPPKMGVYDPNILDKDGKLYECGSLFGKIKGGADVQHAVCTQEAKLCPDGKTSVGRTGPNCEFAKCPDVGSQIDTSNWKTYRNEKYGFEVKYPLGWSIVPEARQPDGSIHIRFMYPESVAATTPIDILIFNLKVGEPCSSRDYFHSRLYAGDIAWEKPAAVTSGVNSWEVLIDHMGAERLFTYLQKEDCASKHVDKIFRFDNYDASQENYDKIISTFRFLQ